MCRFVLYMGPELKMSSLVTEPAHSIIVQSFHSDEREEPLNGDGFGVGWYPPGTGNEPAIFKSVSPAWSNQNLLNLSRVIQSHCILAHVRAASPGLPVSRMNCHPFARDGFTFMHNGAIGDYRMSKRCFYNILSDSAFAAMQGTTDSEMIFAMFLDIYLSLDGPASVEKMATALAETIDSVESTHQSAGGSAECNLNLVVTDGREAVVSRYSSDGITSNSLHIHTGHRYRCDGGNAKLERCEDPTVLVASEPLTRDNSWESVPANHMVLIDDSLDVDIRQLSPG